MNTEEIFNVEQEIKRLTECVFLDAYRRGYEDGYNQCLTDKYKIQNKINTEIDRLKYGSQI